MKKIILLLCCLYILTSCSTGSSFPVSSSNTDETRINLLSVQDIPSQINIGEPVTIQLHKKDIPDDAGLVIFLRKANLEKNTLGITGPIILEPLSISGDGNQEIIWDGKSVGCAPTDFPKWCKGIQPGEYYFEVLLYDTDNFFFLGGPRKKEEKSEKLLQTIKSNTFHILGEYSTKSFSSHFLTTVMGNVSQKYTIPYSGMVQYNRYFQTSDIVEKSGVYCSDISGLSPFSGTITGCTKEIHKTSPNIELTGEIYYESGVIPYQEAIRKAHIIADAPYLTRVAFDHQPTWQELASLGYNPSNSDEWYNRNPFGDTYLSTRVQEWVYRPDGRYWLLVVEEIMAGGKEGLGRFADKVLVKVTDSGEACRVKTVSYDSSNFGVNFYTAPISCEGEVSKPSNPGFFKIGKK